LKGAAAIRGEELVLAKEVLSADPRKFKIGLDTKKMDCLDKTSSVSTIAI